MMLGGFVNPRRSLRLGSALHHAPLPRPAADDVTPDGYDGFYTNKTDLSGF
jgi:hypothetical protein